MTLTSYHLTYNRTTHWWELKEATTGRHIKSWSTKAEATHDGALSAAIGARGSVRIHNESGQLQEERTYPRSADPRRSPG